MSLAFLISFFNMNVSFLLCFPSTGVCIFMCLDFAVLAVHENSQHSFQFSFALL